MKILARVISTTILFMALACSNLALASAWGDEVATPPEGDSVTSPFSSDGYIESADDEASVMPFGMSPSTYQRVINNALQYKGLPYVWGGRYLSQGGFDCTGLVMNVYKNVFGIQFDLMYTNAEKLHDNFCLDIPASSAMPGDLVFWRGTYGTDINRISHVGIYCGNDTVFAAGDPIGYYRIDSSKNIKGQTAVYFFAKIPSLEEGYFDSPTNIPANSTPMYRLYNPNSGEHFYTSNTAERTNLVKAGWMYEGIGWYAPNSGIDVYRLYNPNAGDHHYTTDAHEKDVLASKGWRYEGVGWKSGGQTPLYREYNPNARAGAHNFTTSLVEHNHLKSVGWRDEGIAWYGVQ